MHITREAIATEAEIVEALYDLGYVANDAEWITGHGEAWLEWTTGPGPLGVVARVVLGDASVAVNRFIGNGILQWSATFDGMAPAAAVAAVAAEAIR